MIQLVVRIYFLSQVDAITFYLTGSVHKIFFHFPSLLVIGIGNAEYARSVAYASISQSCIHSQNDIPVFVIREQIAANAAFLAIIHIDSCSRLHLYRCFRIKGIKTAKSDCLQVIRIVHFADGVHRG